MAESQQRRFLTDAEKESFRPTSVEEAAAWLLTEPRRRHLLYFCLHALGPFAVAADAEDVLQDFLLNSLEDVCRCFDPTQGTFLAYFCISLRNECWRRSKAIADLASGRKHFDAVLATMPAPDEPRDAEDLQQEFRDRLGRALLELETRARRAVELHHLEGKTVDDVAAALGVLPNHAKMILHRGRQELVNLVRWESASLVKEEHVFNWPRFCSSLVADQRLFTLGDVLWDRFDDPTRERLQRMVVPSARIMAADRAAIVQALNELLRQSDLWPKRLLSSLTKQDSFSAEARALLRKRKELGLIATLRLNRLVLEYGFSGLIAASSTEGPDHGNHE